MIANEEHSSNNPNIPKIVSRKKLEMGRYEELAKERAKTYVEGRIQDAKTSKKKKEMELYKESAETFYGMFREKKISVASNTIKLAFKLRRNIEEYNETVFHITIAFALGADFIDLIPYAGPIVALGCKGIVIMVLFGNRSMFQRLLTSRWVLIRIGVLFFADLAPLVNKFPLTVLSVWLAFHVIKKKVEESKKGLKVLEKSMDKIL